MFSSARDSFESLLESPPWVRSLANILPLSALVDFVNIPAVLHTYQLTGAIPLWCWPVTPSGSRLLLAEARTADVCCLDRYGNGPSVPICLDGRFGDMYPMVNAETVRRCVQAAGTCTRIENRNPNMLRDDTRVQRLEVIHIARTSQEKQRGTSWQYWWFSMTGWSLLLGLMAMETILGCWTSLAFSSAVLTTGVLVKLNYRGAPRNLSSFRGSEYSRLVITALHVNETDWQVFYGESTIINAFLNRPLRHSTESLSPSTPLSTALRRLLATTIFAQWALAVGAAATQDWNSFLVTAWIVVCVFAQSCIFTPVRAARQWMQHSAKIEVQRYGIGLSTRRALLNTIIALNPDTFQLDCQPGVFSKDALLWIDPILNATEGRKDWLEATRIVTSEALGIGPGRVNDPCWQQRFEEQYWYPFILEGVEMAEKLIGETKRGWKR